MHTRLTIRFFLGDFTLVRTSDSSASWAKTTSFDCSVMLIDMQKWSST
jgi:hypothetical protein